MEKPLMIDCPHCKKEIVIDQKLTKVLEEKLWPSFSGFIMDEASLKIKEKEKIIADLKKQLGIALRKVEQVPNELQGSTQEEAILSTLAGLYPLDIITRTKRGSNGADILHRVFARAEQETGTIYIESKKTENWSNDWPNKLLSDNLKVHADILLIISKALPKGLERFGLIDGIWITDYTHYKELISVLRHVLIKVHSVKTTQEDGIAKQTMLYNYLTGTEFKNTLDVLFGAFKNLKDSHEDEKTRTLRLWKERELYFDKILANAIEINASFKNIAGPGYPDIKQLEAPKKD